MSKFPNNIVYSNVMIGNSTENAFMLVKEMKGKRFMMWVPKEAVYNRERMYKHVGAENPELQRVTLYHWWREKLVDYGSPLGKGWKDYKDDTA